MHDLAVRSTVSPWLAMLSALSCLLLCGGIIHSDVTQRRIPNFYCGAVATLAVAWWVGVDGWAGLLNLVKHLAVPLIAALPLLLLFALRILAGGDVKLSLALLLWIPGSGVAAMVIVTILSGGFLALVLCALKRVFCAVKDESVPYGVPIIAGALLILLPQFRLVL